MRDLATLSAADFEPLLGARFGVALHELPPLAIRLTEVVSVGKAPAGRQPFAVHFEGPAEPVLAPMIHHLSHAEFGELELYLGPIRSAGPGVRYEAVFA